MIFKLIRHIYDWMGDKVRSPYATIWLAFLFFIEAIFFLPVDPILMLFCIENQKRSLYYAAVATSASVLGGLGGYLIGALAWQSIGQQLVNLVISQASFERAVANYEYYQNAAVLIAGFTPLPYKAITLSAGFCRLPVIPFLLCSLISRGARFFLVAGAIHLWGASMKLFIDRYFNQLVVLFTLLVVGSVMLFLR